MTPHVVVIGAGMGGLAAAIRLRRHGYAVSLLEARSSAGGLASDLEADGLRWDGGPYILLDRPGLEWAFQELGIGLRDVLELKRIEAVYQVAPADREPVCFFADREHTAAQMERRWPGAGRRYLRFVEHMAGIHRRTTALLRISRPRLRHALSSGAWRDVPFLLRSLGENLARTGLPEEVQQAVGIWTHVAGQSVGEALAPLALVPALIHTVGAWYPEGGIGGIPRVLERVATEAGVVVRYGARVRAICTTRGRASGVELSDGSRIEAAAVLSNYSGIGTYLELVADVPRATRERLGNLPLQSPGVGAWLLVRRRRQPPYLRFRIPSGGERCRLLVLTGEVDPGREREGWTPARLVAPMDHQEAARVGEEGQRAYLERVLAEPWWREGLEEVRVLATRIPLEWGRAHHLYRDSMNPVMTARFMRAGRVAHRSAEVPGLYLAGSSTHPGQWVSFCAISGILAADQLHRDRT